MTKIKKCHMYIFIHELIEYVDYLFIMNGRMRALLLASGAARLRRPDNRLDRLYIGLFGVRGARG